MTSFLLWDKEVLFILKIVIFRSIPYNERYRAIQGSYEWIIL
ncbi:hypothetical protein U369_15155 [Bacillus anthracis 52-G]|nr:hypothetical protein U368_14990 [Bacillus anthracis 8903-G]EVT98385.1 hypothetical protein U365_12395 [Bacillus anthracis 9080-G]EVU06421.1 hypothetical protein U369_15155 [Bacillus anthracis 52-G]EXJ20176.1 hypothetical protein Y693_14855 [Bacillus anthracis str. 95014]